MTQEDKELLLKDLCARLPYGVMVKYGNRNTPIKCDLDCHPNIDDLENTKPYLRPISSMTVEEDCEFCRLFKCDSVNAMYGYINWVVGGSCDYDDFDIEFSKLAKIIDWLNAHQFDYRGLIPMGLALPATEGIYNIQ